MQIGIFYALYFSFGWFTTWMLSVVEYPLLNAACSCGWFSSSVVSSHFVRTFVSTLYIHMFNSQDISGVNVVKRRAKSAVTRAPWLLVRGLPLVLLANTSQLI